MMLIKLEGSHIDLVKILDVYEEDGYIRIKIKDHKTGRVYGISHTTNPKISHFIWWLVSEDYMMGMLEDRVFRKMFKRRELKFDF